MILLSHPTGNANVRQAALAFEEAQMLAEFWTCLGWEKVPSFLPQSIAREVRRRTVPAGVAKRLRLRPWKEAARLLAARFGARSLVTPVDGAFCVDAVYRDLDRRVARRVADGANGARGVYAYEDGARDTFEAAGRAGLSRIYELPIGYWKVARRLMEEEAEMEPDWGPPPGGRWESGEKLDRKDAELRLADRIVVASSFTRKTLEEADAGHCRVDVIPYGCPPPADAPPGGSRKRGGPLKALFVGSLGRRKGTAYLTRAIEMLGKCATLTLIGSKPPEECRALDQALQQHRWIPSLPHDGVLEEMRRHDVLVFPSLFEGFGLVILEALAQGIPVIATPHTGAPDVLTDGVDGFIVRIRSAEAIAEKLELLHADPERLSAMRAAALGTATRNGWGTYRRRLVESVTDLLDAARPVSA